MRKNGFGLLETLIASTLGVVVMLGLMTLGRTLAKQQVQSTVTFQADQLRRSLLGYLNSARSWNRTIAAAQNSRTSGPALDCLLVPGTPCTDTGADKAAGGIAITDRPIRVVLDAAGQVVYDGTSPSNGFTLSGTPCNTYSATGNDQCPLHLTITWSAVCGASCVNPQVRLSVVPTYTPTNAGSRQVAFNSANYSTTALQGISGRAFAVVAMMGVPPFPIIPMNSTAPTGWSKLPATCTYSGTYCNSANAKTWMDLPFDSEGPNDVFMLTGSARICSTSVPSTTCQPATPPAGQGHGLAIFIHDLAGNQVFYQDIQETSESGAFGSGAVYTNGLAAGSYVASLREYETQPGNYLTVSLRQLAIFKLQ